MVFCSHCGSKLVLTTSSGRREKGAPKRETRLRYCCHNKVRHPQDCTGQTGYSAEKLDGIVDKVVINLFERMMSAPRSQLIQKQRDKELALAKASADNTRKVRDAKSRELESYTAEIIKTINGTGNFGADILGEMIEDTRTKLSVLNNELAQAEDIVRELETSTVSIQQEYDRIISWAELYAVSSMEAKKMIVRHIIDRVNIGRDYEIEIEFKISITQFFDFLHPEGDRTLRMHAA